MSNSPLCIIPARGGSKRIPRKNVRPFNGKPMIAWAIERAIESGVFDRVIVSTDDAEIADISRQFGAEVPFMRDAGLANDFATTADVLIDAVTQIAGFEIGCCLYPTAAMVDVEDLRSANRLLKAETADCVLSVTEYDFPPQRALQRQGDGALGFAYPEHALTRSQDLPELIHDAGMFYFFRVSALLQSGTLLSGRILGHPIPKRRAVDIDTPEDLAIAETLHAALQKER